MRDLHKRKQLFSLLKHKKLDVALIQESHSVDSDFTIWRSQWGGQILCSNGSTQSKGVLLLIRRGLDCNIGMTVKDTNGRYLLIEVEINQCPILICNVYAPNVDSPNFFAEVAQQIQAFDNTNIIWGGDFNFAMDPMLDRKSSHVNNDKARDYFLGLAEELQLVDAWRVLHPDERQYLCCRPNSDSDQWNKFSRLDMIFVSAGLFNAIQKCGMSAGFQSDHSFVNIELDLTEEKRGPGYWKFNVSHLYSNDFLQAANAIIDEAINNVELNHQLDLKWEMVKGKFIQFAKQYSIDKAKSKRAQLDELLRTADEIKAQIEQSVNLDQTLIAKQAVNSKEINTYMEERARGSLIRSRTKYYNEGERSSKYFFSLEKSNAKMKNMKRIRTASGIVSHPKQILKEQSTFYGNLYKSDSSIKFNLDNHSHNKLDEQTSKSINGEITLLELTNAVRTMPNNKAPGLDGLPIEVYKVFWAKLGPLYHEAILEAKRNGQLRAMAKRGVITLIPKKDRDILFLTNWRPLTMLTCDYKILAKALANRMQPILPNIIHPDQTGFMKGRNIATNIRKTIEIIQYTQRNKIPSMIMTIDFEKCFDRIEHVALWGSLEYFGFGQQFISWVKMLFTDFQLCTINNGHMSPFFSSQRSVHQGCPIASSLYLLCGQLLHDLLTQNKDIKGITVNNVEHLLSQFADDTTLFLSYDPLTLQEVVSTLNILHNNTGLKVNYDKTTIYRTGSLEKTQAKIYTTHPFSWSNQPIKLLGTVIPIDMDNEVIYKLNYQGILTKIENIVQQWSLRSLTLSGKIIIINTLIASLLVYKMQVFPDVSDHFICKFNKILRLFLWNDGKTKIANRFLYADKSQGGLRLVNILARQQSLKIQWITLINSDIFWSDIFYAYVNSAVREYIWIANLKPADVKLYVNIGNDPFWYQVVLAWSEYNYTCPIEESAILQQPIWLNSNIRIDGKPINNAIARNAGLVHLFQLFDVNGIPKTMVQINAEFGMFFNWFSYAQLICSIPIDWRIKIAAMGRITPAIIVSKFSKLQDESKISRIVYAQLIDMPDSMFSRKQRWERKLDMSMSIRQFHRHFGNIYRSTIATKYRDFQFRLIAGVLVTNTKLKLWKILECDLCTFCGQAPEDEVHLLCSCPHAILIWEALQDYIIENCTGEVHLDWSDQAIIFNQVHIKPGNAVNLLVLVAKQYIYRCRCFKVKPIADQLINEIEQVYNIEIFIAQKKNKMRQHAMKWSEIKQVEIPDQNFVLQYVDSM